MPTIILDRDGVLNKRPKSLYVRTWDDWEWIPGAKEAINLLKNAGYRIILVTNQSGIARKKMTEQDLHSIHEKMQKELSRTCNCIDKIYYCPHGPDDNCECRKPKPGMLLQAQRDFNLDLSKTYFIGDDQRDMQAGNAAGCKTLLVNSRSSLLKLIKEKVLT